MEKQNRRPKRSTEAHLELVNGVFKLWVSKILEVYLTNLKLMLHMHFFQSQSLGFCHLLNPPGGRGRGQGEDKGIKI